MFIQMLKAKLHRACVTEANVYYEGSLGIDIELMEAVGIHPYEKVQLANINNGSRLETYAIAEPFGSRHIVLNGAAARLGAVGDRIIIMSYSWTREVDVREGRCRPQIIRLDEKNEPVERIPASSTTEDMMSMLEG